MLQESSQAFPNPDCVKSELLVKEVKERQTSSGTAKACVDTTNRSWHKINFLLDKLHNASPTGGPGLSKLFFILIRSPVNNSFPYYSSCPDSEQRSSLLRTYEGHLTLMTYSACGQKQRRLATEHISLCSFTQQTSFFQNPNDQQVFSSYLMIDHPSLFSE